MKRGTLFRAAGPRPEALGRKVQGGGSGGKRQMLDGDGGRGRERWEGGTLCREVPSLERPLSLGTFLSEPQGKVQVSWRVTRFLSEEVIPFYVNVSVKKFAYGVNVPLGEI